MVRPHDHDGANMSSANGTYFRQSAVHGILAKLAPVQVTTVKALAEALQAVDPGCSEGQARYALERLLALSYAEVAPPGCDRRATYYRATKDGRDVARSRGLL